MKNILIVDDNEQNRYMLETFLTASGYSIASASNGAQALEMARAAPPHMVITDILMPVMDGFSLCREWKSDARLNTAPLIFYTATYTDSRDQEFALGLGAERFLIKPMDLDALLETITDVFTTHDPARRNPAPEPRSDETVYLKEYNETLIRKLENKMLALEKSELRYRTLFERNADGLLIADIHTKRFLYANPKLLNMLGYSHDELIALGVENIHPENNLSQVQNTFEILAQRQQTLASNIPCLRKDGTTFFADINATQMEFEGRPCLLGMFRDVTERKRITDELQAMTDRMLLATSAAKIGIWDLDIAGNTLIWDESMHRIYGLPPDRFAGSFEAWEACLHPQDRDRMHEEYLMALNGEKDYDTEFRVIWPDESVHHIRAKGHVARDESGAPLRMIGINMDITGRKQAEAENMAAREQLLKMQKLEILGQLAGGIAHDFNNMLTPILCLAELECSSISPNTPLHQSLSEIHAAALHAKDLTSQLLAFSRKQPLELSVLNISTVISEFKHMLRRLIREDIEIHYHLESPAQSIQGDAGQIRQIIMNIAINADHAMPNGGKLLIETHAVDLDHAYAATHPEVQPGPFVMLSLGDTGCGMSPDTADRIFEPFFTTKSADRGTGLGLSTVHGIVKQHGGIISVYSEPGVGTTFKIYFPAVDKIPEHKPDRQPREQRHGNATVLLAEDDRAMRRLARKILENLGYTVLAAATPGEALAMAARNAGPIHLLVTDVIMPGMNGRELYQEISIAHPAAKVLFMSGYTDNEIAHHGMVDKNIHFIPKPFTVQSFSTKVWETLMD